MEHPLNDSYYHARWKRIVNVIKSAKLGLSRIAPAGSRSKRQHRPDSDYDVIFALSGIPMLSFCYLFLHHSSILQKSIVLKIYILKGYY